MKVLVVGAGIIGAVAAFRLAEAGADVTVIDAGMPASGASGASFGWVNASFYANRRHFDLRLASIHAHRRLADQLPSRATRWSGCLCWEEEGDAFDRQFQDLQELGYDVRLVDRVEFERLEPAVNAPDRALLFAQEAAVDLAALTRDALSSAMSLGAKVITGVAVTGLQASAGRISGVRWSGGVMSTEQVVLAAGATTPAILSDVGVPLPMLDRPGLILRTERLPPLVSHILAAPGQELRQEPDGRFLAPTSASHQSDDTSEIYSNPEHLATAAVERVSRLLQREVKWTELSLAARPVPEDGLPVIGHCGPDGLYVVVMHSGATLAPLAAELVAAEVLGRELSNTQSALIAPYRPERFTA